MNFFERILPTIVTTPELHARWLNTLSFLENSGARKIAACEHPQLVKEEMLKHAAEEFRHAHHLKRQIARVSTTPLPNYSLPLILGGKATLHYLHALDVKASRYLKEQGFSKSALKEAAYHLVTYAIELRAEELYPLYDAVLRETCSRVRIKSIMLEEKEHLKEMQEALQKLPFGMTHAEQICAIENQLCHRWLEEVAKCLSKIPSAVRLNQPITND